MSSTIQILFIIFFILSVVVEIGVLLGLLIAALVTIKKLLAIVEEVKGKALPIVGDLRNVVQDVTPKVKTISGHLVEISATVRDQAKHVNTTVDDVVDKTRAQANKVDEMVSAVLGGLSHAGSTVSAGVSKPVRRISSLLHGLRVGIDHLFAQKTRRNGSAYRAGYEQGAEDDQTIHPPPTTSSPL